MSFEISKAMLVLNVFFVDGSDMAIQLDPATTVKEALHTCCTTLNLIQNNVFALYEVIDPKERMIDENEFVLDCKSEWEEKKRDRKIRI